MTPTPQQIIELHKWFTERNLQSVNVYKFLDGLLREATFEYNGASDMDAIEIRACNLLRSVENKKKEEQEGELK